MDKLYSWSTSEYDNWHHDIFTSVEECIEDSKDYDATGCIYVAEVHPYEIYVNADYILEDLEQIASDECGDVADSWCPSYEIKQSEIDHLSFKLTNIVRAWLKKQHCLPNFYNIGEIWKIDL